MDETIRAWLMELLGPLAPGPDFVYRTLRSAQDAAARGFQGGASMKCDHIHLVIYGPRDQKPDPGTWGYFVSRKPRILPTFD